MVPSISARAIQSYAISRHKNRPFHDYLRELGARVQGVSAARLSIRYSSRLTRSCRALRLVVRYVQVIVRMACILTDMLLAARIHCLILAKACAFGLGSGE